MKRALPIVGKAATAAPPAPTLFVRVGPQLVSVTDAGDGSAARAFAAALTAAGGVQVDAGTKAHPDARLVIRIAPTSPQAQLRGEALEETADVVLGSARPTFAALFAAACARGASS